MQIFSQFLGKPVEVELSGDKKHTGILMDCGTDILVLYNGKHFLYIPATHLQRLSQCFNWEGNSYDDVPVEPIENEKEISYRKILNHARGMFAEIYVTGNQSIHGYVTHLLTNYFVFYSPVFKTMFIPMFHLKWLIPYSNKQIPYSLPKEFLPVNPTDISLSRTFEEQLRKLIGKIVVFDLGLQPHKIGLLKEIYPPIVEFITADEKALYVHIQHIKTVHSPSL